jgi:hypothetical protein
MFLVIPEFEKSTTNNSAWRNFFVLEGGREIDQSRRLSKIIEE